jgi:hypothetical protein
MINTSKVQICILFQRSLLLQLINCFCNVFGTEMGLHEEFLHKSLLVQIKMGNLRTQTTIDCNRTTRRTGICGTTFNFNGKMVTQLLNNNLF